MIDDVRLAAMAAFYKIESRPELIFGAAECWPVRQGVPLWDDVNGNDFAKEDRALRDAIHDAAMCGG